MLNIYLNIVLVLIALFIMTILYFIFYFILMKMLEQDRKYIEKRKQQSQEFFDKQRNMNYNDWNTPYNTENKTSKNAFPECLSILEFSTWPNNFDEIKNQYRTLAKTKHPDMGGSQEEFEKINKAYQDAQQLERYKS